MFKFVTSLSIFEKVLNGFFVIFFSKRNIYHKQFVTFLCGKNTDKNMSRWYCHFVTVPYIISLRATLITKYKTQW